IGLFDNEIERHAMRKKAYQYTRALRWKEVASSYLDLFRRVREERNRNPKPVVHTRPLRGMALFSGGRGELPEIKLDHLEILTDDVGILHNARATVPDRNSGYSLEDNCKALITVL